MFCPRFLGLQSLQFSSFRRRIQCLGSCRKPMDFRVPKVKDTCGIWLTTGGEWWVIPPRCCFTRNKKQVCHGMSGNRVRLVLCQAGGKLWECTLINHQCVLVLPKNVRYQTQQSVSTTTSPVVRRSTAAKKRGSSAECTHQLHSPENPLLKTGGLLGMWPTRSRLDQILGRNMPETNRGWHKRWVVFKSKHPISTSNPLDQYPLVYCGKEDAHGSKAASPMFVSRIPLSHVLALKKSYVSWQDYQSITRHKRSDLIWWGYIYIIYIYHYIPYYYNVCAHNHVI